MAATGGARYNDQGPTWMERALERLTDVTERNTQAISGLQEIAKSHSDAIDELRKRPASTREWLAFVVAVVAVLTGIASCVLGPAVAYLATHLR